MSGALNVRLAAEVTLLSPWILGHHHLFVIVWLQEVIWTYNFGGSRHSGGGYSKNAQVCISMLGLCEAHPETSIVTQSPA
mmetsp:Transcript_63612/g.102453  ORF Transcript_63612/g.102453 Transcript_63612/m.102453 type:complete len:80 (-) Transcript_63612:868-1107(-)